MEQYVEQMKTATEKLKDEARSPKVKGNIDEATEKNVVKNANLVNQQNKQNKKHKSNNRTNLS